MCWKCSTGIDRQTDRQTDSLYSTNQYNKLQICKYKKYEVRETHVMTKNVAYTWATLSIFKIMLKDNKHVIMYNNTSIAGWASDENKQTKTNRTKKLLCRP